MATVIDSLLITLGIDSKPYQKGQKDAETALTKFDKANQKSGKAAQEHAKSLAMAYSKVKNEIIGLAAAALGASSFASFFDKTIKDQANIGRLADDIGISAKSLDAWAEAAKQVGGTSEGLKSSFAGISAGITAFKYGDMSNSVVTALASLQNIGGPQPIEFVNDFNGAMFKLSETLKKLPRQEQLRVGGLLGLDSGTLNLLRDNNIELQSTIRHLTDISNASEENIAKAQLAQKQWENFKTSLSNVATAIVDELLPALTGTDKGLDGVSDWVTEHKSDVVGFFQVLIAVVKALGTAISDTFGWIEKMSSKLLSGTKIGNKIGELTARFLAYGGYKEAVEAVNPTIAKPSASARPATAAASGSKAAQLLALDKANGLPPGTLDKIWANETARGTSKSKVSSVGATGDFQFMPRTAKEYGMSREDTFDFAKSSSAAGKKLGNLLKYYKGNIQKAVMAYNFGEGNLNRTGVSGAPAETQNYWRKFAGAGVNGNTAKVSSNNSEVNIGTMTIQTQATDANGIMMDMRTALQQNDLIYGATLGMN
jgi:hypothetical protein